MTCDVLKNAASESTAPSGGRFPCAVICANVAQSRSNWQHLFPLWQRRSRPHDFSSVGRREIRPSSEQCCDAVQGKRLEAPLSLSCFFLFFGQAREWIMSQAAAFSPPPNVVPETVLVICDVGTNLPASGVERR